MKSKLKTYEICDYIKNSCLFYLIQLIQSYNDYDLDNSSYIFSPSRNMVEIEYNQIKYIKVQIEMKNELEEVFAPTKTISGTLCFPTFIFKLIVNKEDAEILQHVVNCAKDKISWNGGGNENDKVYVFFCIPASENIGNDYASIQKIVMEFLLKKKGENKK